MAVTPQERNLKGRENDVKTYFEDLGYEVLMYLKMWTSGWFLEDGYEPSGSIKVEETLDQSSGC